MTRKHAPHQPLAYDIRDELSVTLSANPFDYDFSPLALAKFRDWLKTQYRSLDALNAQRETRFATWDEVRPFSTDQIKNRMAGGTPDERGIPRGQPDWQALARLNFDPDPWRACSCVPSANTIRWPSITPIRACR